MICWPRTGSSSLGRQSNSASCLSGFSRLRSHSTQQRRHIYQRETLPLYHIKFITFPHTELLRPGWVIDCNSTIKGMLKKQRKKSGNMWDTGQEHQPRLSHAYMCICACMCMDIHTSSMCACVCDFVCETLCVPVCMYILVHTYLKYRRNFIILWKQCMSALYSGAHLGRLRQTDHEFKTSRGYIYIARPILANQCWGWGSLAALT